MNSRKKKDEKNHRDTANWIVAVCAVIAVAIEIARFILELFR